MRHKTLSARISLVNLATAIRMVSQNQEILEPILTLKIVRPKCMTPFGDAVSFVDCDKANFGMTDHLNEPFIVQPFWSNVSIITIGKPLKQSRYPNISQQLQ